MRSVSVPPLMTVISVLSVTPSSVPPLDASSTPPEVEIVPPLMRPLLASRNVPPVPFSVSVPALATALLSTARPLEIQVGELGDGHPRLRLTVAPLTMASPPPLIVYVPFSPRTPPACRSIPLPALVSVVDVAVFIVPPDWTRKVPALESVVGDSVIVPADTFTRPLLVKVVGVIVNNWLTVLPIRAPL